MHWYFLFNDKRIGPVSPSDIIKYLADGDINSTSKVWCEGMEQWTDVSACKQQLESAKSGTDHHTDFKDVVARKMLESAASVVVTTAQSIAGMEVLRTIDIITAECVFGMNVFRDMFAGLRDIFGGRSSATQKVLRDARKTCLFELRKEAMLLGANAVIAVDLDYSEFSGGGKSMLFLVASGTAVEVEAVQTGT